MQTPDILYTTFAESPYGQELASRTRWDVFKPGWVSTQLWGELLGDDVNNLYHMPHTHEIAAQFCEGENLDLSTKKTLLTTAMTHDWGEAIIGDIALPNKTAEDEKREKIAYRKIATELFGEDGEVLTSQVWSVLNHEDKQKGEMFRAIEYIGYCTTAMRAGLTAVRLVHGLEPVDITRDQKDQLLGALLGLEKAVETKNYPILAGYVKKYASIPRQLRHL